MKNFGITLDKTLDSLVGQVRLVLMQTFDIKNGVRTQMDERKVEYTIRGIKKMSIRYDEFLRVKVKQVIDFNDNERKIGYTNYDMFDDQKSSGKYELNIIGLAVAKYHNNDCEERYSYNGDFNITKVYYPNTGAYSLYNYDDNNFVIEQLDVSGESPFGSLLGPRKQIILFENDQFGNVTESKFYNAENQQITSFQKSVYDDKGNEIEFINYNGDGSVSNCMRYKYNYDNNNNWILKQSLSEEGTIYHETVRTITYYE